MTTPETAPDPDTGHESEVDANADADTDAEVDRIREAFAREALDVTPSPVPLEAVRRAGRSRRRRTATFSALSVVTAATAVAAVVGVTYTRPSPPAPSPVAAPPATVTPQVPPPTSRPTPTSTRTAAARTPTPVRVVASGERVDAGKGWKVWLTSEGKHWTGPDGYENTRSVTDGNVDTAEPGVSHQSEGSAAGAFHSGLYYGTRAVGRVELTGSGGGTTTATLLELPGRPGWGVWYAHTGPTGGEASVAMYDRAGKLLTNLPG
ncbi:hypothetical protein R1T08_20935 [Streptomyces sp. SBC-4]|nr:hypothetical protein [Streptomyces sp. SBC-4]MDV5146587.1 hypothetical protein [Streptomyces sp. SBC-4]